MRVFGLNLQSSQGDRAILDILRRFGAEVVEEVNAVMVKPAPLHGIEVDASDVPDLVPPIALVAACAKGKTRIFGAERLKIKESNRLLSVSETLNRLGCKVNVTDWKSKKVPFWVALLRAKTTTVLQCWRRSLLRSAEVRL